MTGSVTGGCTALIAVALISALFEPLLTKQAAKQTLRLITAVSMITIVMSVLVHLDLSEYAASMRWENTVNQWNADEYAERESMLNRTIIESECSAYILDKGRSLHIPIREASVTLRWDTDGYWVPDQARIVIERETDNIALLRDIITTDLGVGPEAQSWSVAHEG